MTTLSTVKFGADKVRPFELFFDLVFVFSLIQITNSIVEDDDLLGVIHGLVVLCIVWWIWASFTSLANVGLPPWFRSDWRPPVFVFAMGVMLLVDISIPTAFWENDRLFAFAVAILWAVWAISQLVLVWPQVALRQDTFRFISVSVILPVMLVASSFISSTPISVMLLTMGLGSVVIVAVLPRSTQWPLGREHLTERYELFLIITLGEVLISIGLGATQAPRNAEMIFGILMSVALVAIMWRTYLMGVADPGRIRMSTMDSPRAMRFTRIGYVFLHLVLVAGVIGVAAGLKVSMKDVVNAVSPLFAGVLLIGLAVFLLTIMAFRRVMSGQIEWWRIIPITVLLLVWPVAGRAPDLVFLAVVTAITAIGSFPDLRPRAEAESLRQQPRAS